MTNVILSGGKGTRLWPLSRSSMPKQFINFRDNKSLFYLTLERNLGFEKHIVVCNQEHYYLALDECEKFKKNCDFILEPFGKNTSAAIAIAAFSVCPDEILLVVPSDHLIKDQDLYIKAVNEAKEYAKQGFIVTFGIKPDSPNTAYGYIKFRSNIVEKFVEKPNLELARVFFESGEYLFNSGMFCFQARKFLDELKKHAPDIYESSKLAFENSNLSQNVRKISPNFMENIENISIDYALMQKSDQIAVVKLESSWSDLGSFDEFTKYAQNSEFYEVKSNNNFVKSSKFVGLVGVDDLMVIDTPDALAIVKKEHSSEISKLYSFLSQSKFANLCDENSKVFRPWGSYEILSVGENFKVKKIVVKPKKRISLQYHKHRSEHWVVVFGVATIEKNSQKFSIKANESVYIKQGDIHRLSNETDENLVMIEVQIGDIVDESDIVRLDDDFKFR